MLDFYVGKAQRQRPEKFGPLIELVCVAGCHQEPAVEIFEFHAEWRSHTDVESDAAGLGCCALLRSQHVKYA